MSTDFSLLYSQTRKYYNDQEKIKEINVRAKYFLNIKQTILEHTGKNIILGIWLGT